jgi:osmotically-inducible protein OsmY
MKSTPRYTALFAAAAATVLIAACGEKLHDTTAGQQVDNSVAQVQSAGTELKNDAQVAANDMQAAGSKAAASVAESATDMAITTKVNAALAADDSLSALKIDVDTEAGNVALTGTAPDEASRARATTLAAAVEGVVTVENRLTVVKNS